MSSATEWEHLGRASNLPFPTTWGRDLCCWGSVLNELTSPTPTQPSAQFTQQTVTGDWLWPVTGDWLWPGTGELEGSGQTESPSLGEPVHGRKTGRGPGTNSKRRAVRPVRWERQWGEAEHTEATENRGDRAHWKGNCSVKSCRR